MTMSKQKRMARSQLRKAYAFHNDKPLPFYSRKYNKWFRSYKGYKSYDVGMKKQYYLKNASYMKYDKRTNKVYSTK